MANCFPSLVHLTGINSLGVVICDLSCVLLFLLCEQLDQDDERLLVWSEIKRRSFDNYPEKYLLKSEYVRIHSIKPSASVRKVVGNKPAVYAGFLVHCARTLCKTYSVKAALLRFAGTSVVRRQSDLFWTTFSGDLLRFTNSSVDSLLDQVCLSFVPSGPALGILYQQKRMLIAPSLTLRRFPSAKDSSSSIQRKRVCYAYNNLSGCSKQRCDYRHVCLNCKGKHPKFECSSSSSSSSSDKKPVKSK